MSGYLIGLLIVSAGLLGAALAMALRSFERDVDRVTEYTRTRLVERHPYGTSRSGNVLRFQGRRPWQAPEDGGAA